MNAKRRETAKERDVVAIVKVRCVECGMVRDVRSGDIVDDDFPMCSCGSPMIATGAVSYETVRPNGGRRA